jgi:hypothetical protein
MKYYLNVYKLIILRYTDIFLLNIILYYLNRIIAIHKINSQFHNK